MLASCAILVKKHLGKLQLPMERIYFSRNIFNLFQVRGHVRLEFTFAFQIADEIVIDLAVQRGRIGYGGSLCWTILRLGIFISIFALVFRVRLWSPEPGDSILPARAFIFLLVLVFGGWWLAPEPGRDPEIADLFD